MKKSNELIELTLIVNQELKNYVKIHDYIHSESETFRSSIKNLFGHGVPMNKLLGEAERLIPIWESLRIRIDEFRTIEFKNLSDDQKYYIDLLACFVNALNITVLCLVAKQKTLASGADNYGSLSWKEHQERRTAYEEAINQYCSIGNRLNAAKHLIFI